MCFVMVVDCARSNVNICHQLIVFHDMPLAQGDQILIFSFRDTGSARPEELQPEARSAKSGGRVLGKGQPAQSPSARRYGGAV